MVRYFIFFFDGFLEILDSIKIVLSFYIFFMSLCFNVKVYFCSEKEFVFIFKIELKSL